MLDEDGDDGDEQAKCQAEKCVSQTWPLLRLWKANLSGLSWDAPADAVACLSVPYISIFLLDACQDGTDVVP